MSGFVGDRRGGPVVCWRAGRVGDRDDREARLDGLAVGERDLLRRRVHRAARLRDVRSSAACAHAAAGSARAARPRRAAIERRRLTRASASRAGERARRAPRTTPTAPTTSAMIASVELLPPPPSERLRLDRRRRVVGRLWARTSRRPSRRSRSAGRRTCTSSLERLAEEREARRPPRSARLPPLQVTFVITASSPEPVCCTVALPARDGTNESMLKPDGGVSSICVVVASSFSVGTASVKTWLVASRARRAG